MPASARARVGFELDEERRRPREVVDQLNARAISFAVARGYQGVDARRVLAVLVCSEVRAGAPVGDPRTVHDLEQFVLAVVCEDGADVVKSWIHVAVGIIRSIAEVGPIQIAMLALAVLGLKRQAF